jgi:hypothetical protein
MTFEEKLTRLTGQISENTRENKIIQEEVKRIKTLKQAKEDKETSEKLWMLHAFQGTMANFVNTNVLGQLASDKARMLAKEAQEIQQKHADKLEEQQRVEMSLQMKINKDLVNYKTQLNKITVAAFEGWPDLGRHVMRGEKAHHVNGRPVFHISQTKEYT